MQMDKQPLVLCVASKKGHQFLTKSLLSRYDVISTGVAPSARVMFDVADPKFDLVVVWSLADDGFNAYALCSYFWGVHAGVRVIFIGDDDDPCRCAVEAVGWTFITTTLVEARLKA